MVGFVGIVFLRLIGLELWSGRLAGMLALCMCGVRAPANYDLPLTEHGPNRERKRETERERLRE